MRKLFIFALIIFTCTFLNPTPAAAQTACQYNSTQARVQKDINDPWKSRLSAHCGETFNVGSFHNNTGQFATDTKIEIKGRVYNQDSVSIEATNGQTITLPQYAYGTYTVKVTTPGQSGRACRASATVRVTCDRPPSCMYDSTQARVQATTNDPWVQKLSLLNTGTFNIGSFHNNTGQFAEDTKLVVYGPRGSKTYTNGATVEANKSGLYTLSVSTSNQSGANCKAKAYTYVFPALD